jgi:hypothetical protein
MGISSFPVPSSGIPSGNTAGRPSSPAIGDTYYNGELSQLEIYTDSGWQPCSAPPDKPTIAVTDGSTSSAYASTAGVLTVVITPGNFGGLPIQYTATTTTGISATTTSSTVSLTGLTPGTSYVVSGQTANGFGRSLSSDTTTITPTTLPEAPTIGTATQNAGTSSVLVTWTLNSNGGKALSAITITPYLNGTTAGTAQTAATTSSTSHTFTGLSVGSSYTFKVKTTNANGVGAESSATNSVTIIEEMSVDFLVLAGGGAGGNTGSNNTSGGGGGAGGLRTSVSPTGGNLSVPNALTIIVGSNYTVTVGAGAAASNTNYGSDSVFANITSKGGGSGSGWNGGGGNAGGCGGGSGVSNVNLGAGSSVDNSGYGGGTGTGTNNNANGGGGGGTGSAGFNGSNNVGAGGDGGNYTTNSITGTSVRYGPGGGGGSSSNTYYANGGDTSSGSGTDGRGARGNGADVAYAGAANRGGGGGGGFGTVYGTGAAGGSGVVILRYPNTRTITTANNLTATTNTSGNNKVTAVNAGTGNVSWA